MSDFYIAAEASIPYELVGPSGARAVLNDPSDSDFVGYLDGEDAITGIDSPEVRDSFAELAGRDGALSGVNFYSRRPIVMNGRVIPTSAADRNQKLGKLMAATDAMRADGTLSWTPSGGEPVFLKFRRQLPFRAKGGFNKEFQIGLVANDPRIFSKRSFMFHMGTDATSAVDDYWRFSHSSGSGVGVAVRNAYCPPGRYRATVPVRCSAAGKTARIVTSGTVNEIRAPVTTNGSWQLITVTFEKTTPEATTISVALHVDSGVLTSGQFADTGNMLIEGLDGQYISDTAGFSAGWYPYTEFTVGIRTIAPPPAWIKHPGNAISHPRIRMRGPFTLANVAGATANLELSMNGTYSASQFYVADTYWRTVYKYTSGVAANDYASLHSSTVWGGLPPDTLQSPLIRTYSGGSTDTCADMTWRGVWI